MLVAFMVDAGANASNMLAGYNGMGAGVGIFNEPAHHRILDSLR